MKTNHSITTLLLLLSLGMTSCSTYYRMTSRIDTNGSMHREVYARGDSAFIAGNKTHNPFLFQLDTDWQIVNLDSTLKFNFWGEEEKLNVKACRNIPLINGEYFSISNGKEQMSSLAIPTEQLKKRFKWFYTYYIYTATYKELPDKGPVPLDKYLNKEEQIIWFRGDNAAFSGMNGIEQNDKLDKLEAKFGEWYNRSQYEVIWEVIRQFTSQKGDTVYVNRLNELKETVYTNHLSGKDSCGDAGIDDVCALFDKVGQTNYYLELYKAHAEAMDNMCEQKIKIAEVFYHAIQFELTMPGTLLSSNASLSTNNIMVWKIDGLRLLTGNYVLTAESRVINYWAFGLTLLIILATLGIFIKLYRNR
ncbi:hypothetical protein [Bacteroides caccae]|jgi:hypothetical protein|uniref:hypothetical protein n=1 Tax=Bacteroides caccae TaxID=47678 RepID=UPI00189F2444|nr:hypothetical protein [Bacteroides caccae]